MPDREKIIKGLEMSYKYSNVDENNTLVPQWIVLHAIALLKAQEPKPVYVTAEINYRKIGECPNCGKLINSEDYPSYCGNCGQAVKWE